MGGRVAREKAEGERMVASRGPSRGFSGVSVTQPSSITENFGQVSGPPARGALGNPWLFPGASGPETCDANPIDANPTRMRRVLDHAPIATEDRKQRAESRRPTRCASVCSEIERSSQCLDSPTLPNSAKSTLSHELTTSNCVTSSSFCLLPHSGEGRDQEVSGAERRGVRERSSQRMSKSSGLVRCSSKPARRARVRSSGRA